MLKVRPDQISALNRAFDVQQERRLAAYARTHHPDKVDPAAIANDVLVVGNSFDIVSDVDLMRLIDVFVFLLEWPHDDEPWRAAIVQVLGDDARSADLRLTYVEDEIIPRMKARRTEA